MADLTLRPIEPGTDSALLHAWVQADRATFWGMQDKSPAEVQAIYEYIDQQPHLAAYLVEDRAGTALALTQTYDPAVDEIGEFYDRRPGDLGLHCFLADTAARAGRTAEISRFVIDHWFARDDVQRLVGEPDAANAKSCAMAERLGMVKGPRTRITTTIMDKEAQFYFLTRDRWARVRESLLTSAGR